MHIEKTTLRFTPALSPTRLAQLLQLAPAGKSNSMIDQDGADNAIGHQTPETLRAENAELPR